MNKNLLIVLIIILILLGIFFFPKSCGGVGSLPATAIDCPCIGIKADSPMNKYTLDFSAKVCYGICLKSKCENYSLNP